MVMIEIEKLKTIIPYASNSYLISSGNECAVIDPSAPFIPEQLEGRELKYILLTHGHFDHFLEIDSWIAGTNARVIISKNDKESLADSHKNCYSLFLYRDNGYYGEVETVSEGDTLLLGNDQIIISEYPGHTPGSIVYTVGTDAFVGDVAFAGGGYGRFDLPGGNMKALMQSLERIIHLDDNTVLHPGHGDITTVADYKKHLYY
jgi:glyoxylase-like metal-dependent hydrolase (beta-lactamase superfamily II)